MPKAASRAPGSVASPSKEPGSRAPGAVAPTSMMPGSRALRTGAPPSKAPRSSVAPMHTNLPRASVVSTLSLTPPRALVVPGPSTVAPPTGSYIRMSPAPPRASVVPAIAEYIAHYIPPTPRYSTRSPPAAGSSTILPTPAPHTPDPERLSSSIALHHPNGSGSLDECVHRAPGPSACGQAGELPDTDGGGAVLPGQVGQGQVRTFRRRARRASRGSDMRHTRGIGVPVVCTTYRRNDSRGSTWDVLWRSPAMDIREEMTPSPRENIPFGCFGPARLERRDDVREQWIYPRRT
ncbi:hypothetical protein BJ170DRAFT_599528 [Xylariales sp. AK1849]|nr:hypothetical protein BJ170DRAFT_599528 [Xylariales sp. AK1849]